MVRFGSGRIAIGTIQHWIAGLKSEDSEYALRVLGPQNINCYEKLKGRSRVEQLEQKSKPVETNYNKTYCKREYLEYICECVREKKEW